MTNRREFFKNAAATAGVVFTGCNLLNRRLSAQQGNASKRRKVTVGGRPIRTIDIHAHVIIPEATALMGTKTAPDNASVMAPTRFETMDEWGTDMQALSINPTWYSVDRDVAGKMIQVQNEKLAELCAKYPDRFVAFASVALQFPDMAAEQLEEGVKKYKLRGAAIGGHVNGDELSAPKFDPFWRKAEELGCLVFMHPQGIPEMAKRFQGNGGLANVIGNPLETTIFLSHLIFDGTLDKFPGLKICAGHAGGYLPSYLGRSEAACVVRPNANCANKKRPSEYFKRELLIDTMIFSDEGLRHLVAEMGVGQIVYGTDIPFNWPVGVDLVLNARFLSDADKEAILVGNVGKLLRIPA